MSAMSRAKGQTGEREIAALIRDLTGWDVRRRVRQHDGDSDLEGVPGWSVEVKRHARATRSEIAGWWAQRVAQAERVGAMPVLLFRLDRDAWRAVWPITVNLTEQPPMWAAYAWTAEGSAEAWAAVALELASDQPELGASSRHAPSVSAGASPAAMYPTTKEST